MMPPAVLQAWGLRGPGQFPKEGSLCLLYSLSRLPCLP